MCRLQCLGSRCEDRERSDRALDLGGKPHRTSDGCLFRPEDAGWPRYAENEETWKSVWIRLKWASREHLRTDGDKSGRQSPTAAPTVPSFRINSL